MPYCANPKCQRAFAKATPRQIYCDPICGDQARHAKSYANARLRRAGVAPQAAEHSYSAELEAAIREREANDKLNAESLDVIHDIFGYKPKDKSAVVVVKDTGKTEFDEDQPKTAASPFAQERWTKEQAEAHKKKQEEERLIKLDKANRAQKKRDRAIARGAKIDESAAVNTSKSASELKDVLPNRWIEDASKDKDLEDI